MSKKLISIRIDEDILSKLDFYRETYNLVQDKYYGCYYRGYLSRADVIESACQYYFIHCLDKKY